MWKLRGRANRFLAIIGAPALLSFHYFNIAVNVGEDDRRYNMDQKGSRTRALAISGTDVGLRRHHLYKNAHRRIKQAIEAGFHLEAITLVESLLSDRLESRASYIRGRDFSFKTLDALIKRFREVKPDSDKELQSLILNEVAEWKDARNKALHEMAKLSSDDDRNWDARYKEIKPVAVNGLKVLAAVDRRVKTMR